VRRVMPSSTASGGAGIRASLLVSLIGHLVRKIEDKGNLSVAAFAVTATS
jgi:hypothetical protein